jgi:hypothetical protein
MAFAYRGTARHLASLWALPPLYDRAVSTTFVREVTMAFDAARSEIFDRLEERLRLAPALVSGLFAEVVSGACRPLPDLGRSGGMARLDRLVAAGAWTDAALVLVELELPAWSLKRLFYEGGEKRESEIRSQEPGMTQLPNSDFQFSDSRF